MSVLEASDNPWVNLAIAVVIIAFVVYRQSAKRAVKADARWYINILLLGVGILQAQPLFHEISLGIGVSTLGSLALGAGLGLLRGAVTTLSIEHGITYRRGNLKTVGLWLLGIAAHVALGALTGGLLVSATAKEGTSFSSATVLIYVAITLSAQKLIIQRRANSLRILHR